MAETESSLSSRQLDLLRRMAELTPAPCVMGGFAEDALLAGTPTRAHGDVDWLLPRHELDMRLVQARALGFAETETWGEAAPGEPFYLFAQSGDLKLEIGITDEEDGEILLKVHKLSFEIGGKEAPAGYAVVLPPDTYAHPPVELAGIPIRVASPLALYQIRVGIASRGSFGTLSERHRQTSRKLRDAFLAGRSDADLAPPIRRLGA